MHKSIPYTSYRLYSLFILSQDSGRLFKPYCPDFSNESEARIRTQKIEHILAYTLPIIAQLLISADTAHSNRETEPESINRCLTGKLELLDKMQTETPNPGELVALHSKDFMYLSGANVLIVSGYSDYSTIESFKRVIMI